MAEEDVGDERRSDPAEHHQLPTLAPSDWYTHASRRAPASLRQREAGLGSLNERKIKRGRGTTAHHLAVEDDRRVLEPVAESARNTLLDPGEDAWDGSLLVGDCNGSRSV